VDAVAYQALTGATAAQMSDLEAFRVRLCEANAVMNLVGPASLDDFWNRHVFDSAQLLDLAPEALTWSDLGAGAGLPGLVLAILLKDRPGARVWLIDGLAKRCRFLESVVTALDLPAEVIWGRAEDQRLSVEVVTARAVAPLSRLLTYAHPYHQAGARGLYLKGEKAEAEVAEARAVWQFKAGLTVSRSDPRGRIVSIGSLRRAP
jgi:16S rRNA (guanine527-N7)-methyltransferase